MEIRKDKYQFWIELDDLEQIKKAFSVWGKSEEVVNRFSGARLKELYDEWESFVETDWENWSIYEYDHDIGVRLWIQIAVENSSRETSKRLIEAVKPIDEEFIQNMRPSKYANKMVNGNPFKEKAYFWQLNTIYPKK